MHDIRKDKVSFIGRYRHHTCHHCGTCEGKLYAVNYFDNKTIYVCEECYKRFHTRANTVVLYINKNNTPIYQYFDKKTDCEDFLSINYADTSFGIKYDVHLVEQDADLNDGNILEQALFITCITNNRPAYFVVPTIRTFSSFDELMYVINKVLDRGCVFYSSDEGIDTSTQDGMKMVSALKSVTSIMDRQDKRRIAKGLAAKKRNNQIDTAAECVNKTQKKKQIQKGYTPPEFHTAVARWRNGYVSINEAAEICGMSATTFRRRLKKFGMI